jgi:tRNA(Ile)-lysidine synthase
MDCPAAPDAGAADRISRLKAALGRLWPEGRDSSAKLGLALSGGPDSTALLLLLAEALPGRVEAATVDHGLRAESADEAMQAARVCETLGVPHETLRVEVAAGNLQAEARAARYAALADWMERRGLAGLATAHHADDQAETLLARLNRASGVAGLAGARARGRVPVAGTRFTLVRPVLDWRREELAEVVAAAGLPTAQDPSNADERFDRVRIRKALAGSDWLDVSAIARSAEHLADADAALDWMADMEWRSCVRREPMGLAYRPQAPRAVALRVIERIVAELDGASPRGSAAARLYEDLCEGRPASIGALVVRPDSAGWSFAKAPPRRTAPKRG